MTQTITLVIYQITSLQSDKDRFLHCFARGINVGAYWIF